LRQVARHPAAQHLHTVNFQWGQHVSPTTFADLSVISVKEKGLEYQVIRKTSTGQYMIWHAGLDGVLQTTDAVLIAAQIKTYEPIFR